MLLEWQTATLFLSRGLSSALIARNGLSGSHSGRGSNTATGVDVCLSLPHCSTKGHRRAQQTVPPQLRNRKYALPDTHIRRGTPSRVCRVSESDAVGGCLAGCADDGTLGPMLTFLFSSQWPSRFPSSKSAPNHSSPWTTRDFVSVSYPSLTGATSPIVTTASRKHGGNQRVSTTE